MNPLTTSTLTLGVLALALSSCVPYPEPPPNPGPPVQAEGVEEPKTEQTDPLAVQGSEPTTPPTTPTINDPVPPPTPAPTRPTTSVARPVPGKPGFVFSPYNNKIIDVKGIPSGTLVADPTYP